MKILFDQGTPVPLRRHLTDHEVITAYELGWSNLKNGELLRAAEEADFQILITTDQNLRYQQNLVERRIAIVVLLSTSWPRIELQIAQIHQLVDEVQVGEYHEIVIPYSN
ncbi:MAG: DUF5615 family PIN-like protein [Herpetosiphon sp.]|nr:DUF5615 family PIN-like protein [Herpetosiphon sp.]